MKYKGELYGKTGNQYFLCKQDTDYIDELKKDKARLDWLEKQEVIVATACDGLELFGFNPAFSDTPPNIRELIDAAIEADK